MNQADELRDRLASRAWRISNLHTILTKGSHEDDPLTLHAFKPNLAQRTYYNNRHTKDAILKARKLGLSTFKAVEFADLAQFQPRTSLGIIDYTIDDAVEKLSMVRTTWQHLDNGDIHPATWRLGAELKRKNPLITDNQRELEWQNGARCSCSTTFRGRTPQHLWLSEFGKIAAFAPKKAAEIINGALNSILPGQTVTSESTHEGAKAGEHYRILRMAMKNADRTDLSAVDWRFHFFAWHDDPRYSIDPKGQDLRPEIARYFSEFSEKHPEIILTDAQKYWYDRKQEEQGYGMKKEFPTTPGEAFESLIQGAIYGRDLQDLRAGGRVCDLVADPSPLFTFWDIGFSDYTAIWLLQLAGRDVLIHRFHQDHRQPFGSYAHKIREWEREFARPLDHHFLPHDAETHDKGSGQTPLQFLIHAGISARDITIVPRTKDVWTGINAGRNLIARSYFDRSCDEPTTSSNGFECPSGLQSLENYRTKVTTADGFETNTIIHDENSHPADAFRTFAEAHQQGLIHYAAARQPAQVSIHNPSRFSPSRR